MARVLIIGKSGQLAQAFSGLTDVVFAGRKEMDMADLESVREVFLKHKPAMVVNTAAYTAVDLAESDQENAFMVNEVGARNVAVCCADFGAELIHISTDYVFDGSKDIPYKETDRVNPLGIYGESKLAGEKAVLEVLDSATIVRTGWLYGGVNSNFVSTMLRLGESRNELAIVSDQYGRPTFVNDLRDAVLEMIAKGSAGIYHFSNSGDVVSWYDFAVQIFKYASDCGLKTPEVVRAIPSSEYPTAAARPVWSVLDISKYESEYGEVSNWKTSLEFYFSNKYKKK